METHHNHNLQGPAWTTLLFAIWSYIGDFSVLFAGVDVNIIQPLLHIGQLAAAVVAITVGLRAIRKDEKGR